MVDLGEDNKCFTTEKNGEELTSSCQQSRLCREYFKKKGLEEFFKRLFATLLSDLRGRTVLSREDVVHCQSSQQEHIHLKALCPGCLREPPQRWTLNCFTDPDLSFYRVRQAYLWPRKADSCCSSFSLQKEKQHR